MPAASAISRAARFGLLLSDAVEALATPEHADSAQG